MVYHNDDVNSSIQAKQYKRQSDERFSQPCFVVYGFSTSFGG